ncbi:MAG: threonine synthase [Trueperaceae bacterium]
MTTAPRFVSTRDPRGGAVTFEDALLRGLAPDGGLYVPDRVPPIAPGWRASATLPAAAEATLAPWFDEDEAGGWLADARAALDFPVPLRRLDDETWLLELFHGPTRAFKDVAARTLGRWWARALARHGREALVLVATSGDTGGAVAAGMAGVPGLRVVVLFPRDGVSPVQRAQLTAVRPGVHAFAVEGSFDDCQRLVKEAFRDPGLADLPLTSANSINLGRWLPQAAFHTWGLAQLARAGLDPAATVVVVPSGNLGDLAAGMLAAAMGAAPARFVAAHNANAYLVERLAGRRAPFDFPPTVSTLSNAMDVGAPSNYERIHALWPEDPPTPLSAERVDDDATLARMTLTHERYGVVVCPHTAVGLEAVERDRGRLGGGRRPSAWLVLATAHPAKFPEVVARALPGVAVEDPVLAANLADPGGAVPLSPALADLRRALLALGA